MVNDKKKVKKISKKLKAGKTLKTPAKGNVVTLLGPNPSDAEIEEFCRILNKK